ncbi:MAG: peptidoglycan bridge formation glycyltransferase FemA/FemB family protein [Candidatus Pacebacteria bacterium]|nr:peptidoglycan bridge formation glycyltransferase FemA/FemB family protein [Candidatus Paceibacterota bacterium]
MIKIEPVADKKIWEKFVLSQSPTTFLQSWNWGDFHQSLGKKIFRIGFWEKKKITGAVLLIKEEAKRGVFLTCPGGPLIDWENGLYFRLFVKKVKELAKEEGCVFARVRPSIKAIEKNKTLFKKAGFVKAPMHLHAETTLQIDLNRPETEIIANMEKKTRYCLRRALKNKLTVEISRKIEDIELLYRLQMAVVGRRGFVPFSKNFFKKHFLAFAEDNQIALIKVSLDKELLAIGMFVFYGDTAVYHYSGSVTTQPQAFASYAMIWAAVKEAKRRGLKVLDLWGIAPSDDPRHRFAGVTRFKKGFGGNRVDWLPARDLPFSKKYWGIFAFESLRRILRHL